MRRPRCASRGRRSTSASVSFTSTKRSSESMTASPTGALRRMPSSRTRSRSRSARASSASAIAARHAYPTAAIAPPITENRTVEVTEATASGLGPGAMEGASTAPSAVAASAARKPPATEAITTARKNVAYGDCSPRSGASAMRRATAPRTAPAVHATRAGTERTWRMARPSLRITPGLLASFVPGRRVLERTRSSRTRVMRRRGGARVACAAPRAASATRSGASGHRGQPGRRRARRHRRLREGPRGPPHARQDEGVARSAAEAALSAARSEPERQQLVPNSGAGGEGRTF